MKQIMEFMKKYRIQILSIIIILLLIPIVKITFDKINKNYKVEAVNQEKYFILESKGKYGIIDESGAVLIKPEYYEIHISNPSKPIFVCYYDYNEETGKCRTKVINSQRTELFTKYNNIETINLNGIETTMPYEKNLLKYKKNNKYGLINLDGEVITEAIYDEIDGLSCKEGEILVKKDEKYGVINNRGVKLIDIKYDYIAGDEYYKEKEGYKFSGYIVGEKKSNGYRYGYLDQEHKILLNTEYNEIQRIGGIEGEDTDNNIFLIARKNGQCGLLKNRKVIIDYKYQEINYSGVENLFIIARSKKLGLVNIKGKSILDTKFSEILVNKDYIYTTINNEEKYFDLRGKELSKNSINLQEEIEEEETISSADLVNPTLIPKQKDGKWGFVDKNSIVKVDYIYEEVTEVNKYGYAGIKKDGKWGSIDEKGNIIQEPIYDLEELDEKYFIGKYYKVVYDYKNIFYTAELNVSTILETM